MRKNLIAAALGGVALVTFAAPSSAAAQAPTGAELQEMRVQMPDGAMNLLYFQPDGTVRIASSTGAEVAQGRWFVQNQMLCLELGPNARECWPYQEVFEAMKAVNLTSDCGATSQWTALSTRQQAPVQMPAPGERG